MQPLYKDHPLGQFVTILGRHWPIEHEGPKPGDFEQFANKGLGMDVPVVIQPWDDLDDAMRRPSYYGSEPPSANPITNAPVNDAGGGCIYFDGGVSGETVQILARTMGVGPYLKKYAVFFEGAGDTKNERYLHQIRIVGAYGLSQSFRIPDEALDEITEQQLTIVETIQKFIELEREIWGTGYSRALDGTLGGDGDWAREALAFGLLVENSFQDIYRVWSRPWLVTK